MGERKNQFVLNNVAYHDSSLGIDLTLTVNCWLVHDAEPSADEELKSITSEIITALAAFDIPYANITHEIDLIFKSICSRASKSNNLKNVSIKGFGFTELYPADSDYPRIIESNRLNAPKQPTAQIPQQTTASESSDSWTCPNCNAQQKGRFCNRCGTSKTEAVVTQTTVQSFQQSQLVPGALYDAVLASYRPDKKISIIAMVRKACGLGLFEAKSFVENVPSTIKMCMDSSSAEMLKAEFAQAGATVELKRCK